MKFHTKQLCREYAYLLAVRAYKLTVVEGTVYCKVSAKQ